MLRFLILFMVILTTLFTVEMLAPVQQAVVLPWTGLLADLSGWLMQLFDNEVAVNGKIIRSTTSSFGVSIEPGCNGVEAMIVLLAAIIAFPAPLLYKLKGLLAGFVAIQALNLARIISLFYLGLWNATLFEWAHLYIWQALIMLDALIVFLVWVRFIPGGGPARPTPDNSGEASVGAG
ncbi:MAG: exosortase H [Gammaproteobacteria bacterium]|nr:exosortase H [Gammaproteobacteria bacterium]MBK8133895.1 exosortase H [Gammaproteobacteria bacterium]